MHILSLVIYLHIREKKISPIVYIRDIILIVAHVEHMYTISADFFANFYNGVIAVIIPSVTVTVCEAVVNDPVAPVGRSPIVAI